MLGVTVREQTENPRGLGTEKNLTLDHLSARRPHPILSKRPVY